MFTDDFETYQYILGSIEHRVHVSYTSQLWHHHITEAIREMLSREPDSRLNAKQRSGWMSVYAMILRKPNPMILTQASVFMSYYEWNTLADVSHPRMAMLFELFQWYDGKRQDDVYYSLIRDALKDRSEVQHRDLLTCKVERV